MAAMKAATEAMDMAMGVTDTTASTTTKEDDVQIKNGILEYSKLFIYL